MRKLLLLAGLALVASFVFATAVAAQPEDTPPEEKGEAMEMQGEEDPGVLAPGPVGETEEYFGEPEVIETPLEEAIEEPVEEAIGADAPEPPAEEAIEEKAQQQTGITGTAKVEEGKLKVDETVPLQPKAGYAPLPKSGGPTAGAVLLPAAALLLGAGLLTYAILRRR
jgi:hypothetical protein